MRLVSSLLFALLVVIPDATPRAQQPTAPDKPAVTLLTGCLKSSAADTAVAGPSGRIYTLEVIEAPAKVPATSTGGAANPPAASKTTYSLSASEAVALASHVDHEVQLTGQLQTPTAPAKSSAGASATDRQPTPGGAHRTFQVTALKMVAPKCRS